MFKSYKQFIDAWPSLHSFADEVGVTYENAKAMRRRDAISSDHWKAMVSAAAQRGLEGVTLEALADVAASRRGPRPMLSEPAMSGEPETAPVERRVAA